MITVTDTAAKKIKANLARRGSGVGIRVGVRTTGCSGMAYTLEYLDYGSDAVNPLHDMIFERDDGVIIVVDHKAMAYLKGMEIDYVRQGLNEGFEFRNPMEKDRCGCGESFRV